MPITKHDLDEIFTYQPPADNAEIDRYVAIRDAAKVFAEVVLANTPHSPDQTATIRKIREAVMTANASIALKGRF